MFSASGHHRGIRESWEDMKNVIDTDVFKGSWGQREVCDEKFALGQDRPHAAMGAERGPRFVTCKCVGGPLNPPRAVQQVAASRIRAVIKSDRSSRAPPHLFRVVVLLLSIYGTLRSTPDDREESSAFPRPWILPCQHDLSGTHKAEFALFMSRPLKTPLLIISSNFHKKPPRSRLRAKACFQVFSVVDVITKNCVSSLQLWLSHWLMLLTYWWRFPPSLVMFRAKLRHSMWKWFPRLLFPSI